MKIDNRVKMIKAMEYIMRNLNDESQIESWLMCGVADGDIDIGDTEYREDDREDLETYIEDSTFADIMALFVDIMKEVNPEGGLYCDGVISQHEVIG